jgi:hypothetical protein
MCMHVLLLNRLDLSENKLDSVSAHALSAFLRDPDCGLQELYLGKGQYICNICVICIYICAYY